MCYQFKAFCKLLWIAVSTKCPSVNVNVSLFNSFNLVLVLVSFQNSFIHSSDFSFLLVFPKKQRL